MNKRTLESLNEIYSLDLDSILNKINKINAKKVILQFPEGLKLYSCAIVDYLEEKTENVDFFIFLGDCYGACDTPVGFDNLGIDLIVQFGHNSLMPNYLTK